MAEYSHIYPINRTIHFRPAISIVNIVRAYYEEYNRQIDIWVGQFLERGGGLSPLSITNEYSKGGGRGGKIKIKISGNLSDTQLKKIADRIGAYF